MINSEYKRLYILPVTFSTAEKVITLLLVLIPIQALRSMSRGQIGRKSSFLFNFFGLDLPNQNEILFFFSKIFLFLIVAMLIIKILKVYFLNFLSKKIITDIIEKYLIGKKINQKRLGYEINKLVKFKDKEIESRISIISTFIFLLSLFIGIIIIDLQIALIIFFGAFITYIIFNYLAKNEVSPYQDKSINKLLLNEEDNNTNKVIKTNRKLIDEYIIYKIDKTKREGKSLIKHSINAIIIVTIMILLFTRENPALSILFIIIIRLYLGQMHQSVQKILRYKNNSFKDNELEYID